MSVINNGGPAFPVPEVVLQSGVVYPSNARGMTLRDWFAGQAMAALIANNMLSDTTSGIAYCYADAMLAAREASK